MGYQEERIRSRNLNAISLEEKDWRNKIKIKRQNANKIGRHCELVYSLELVERIVFKSHGVCFYTGLRFVDKEDVTFERINPLIGYTEENTVLCCSFANSAKANYDAERHDGVESPSVEKLHNSGFLFSAIQHIIKCNSVKSIPNVVRPNLYVVLFRKEGEKCEEFLRAGELDTIKLLQSREADIKYADVFEYDGRTPPSNWHEMNKVTNQFIKMTVINRQCQHLEGYESHNTGFNSHLNQWIPVWEYLPLDMDMSTAIGQLWCEGNQEIQLELLKRSTDPDYKPVSLPKPLHYIHARRNWPYAHFRMTPHSYNIEQWEIL